MITQTLITAIGDWPTGVAFLINNAVTSGAGTGWVFVVVVITVHIGLSLLLILFIWYHVKRLSRPKILPPRYWTWLLLGLLVVASVAVPVGMLPGIDPGRIPGDLTIDWFYLFYLPAGLNWPPLLLWGGGFVFVVAVSLVPWLAVRKPLPPIVVHEDLCTGCGLCPPDCPYEALEMLDTPGSHHRQVAVVDPKMCVSCGVCIGSCPELALTLGDRPAEAIWSETLALVTPGEPVEVVFTCERHSYHGARPYLNERHFDGEQRLEVVPVTCVGMIHPRLVQEALDGGASSVRLVGCPPEDCTNREGNLWLSERIERKRKPRLGRALRRRPDLHSLAAPQRFRPGVRDKHAGDGTDHLRFRPTPDRWEALPARSRRPGCGPGPNGVGQRSPVDPVPRRRSLDPDLDGSPQRVPDRRDQHRGKPDRRTDPPRCGDRWIVGPGSDVSAAG